MRRIDGLFYLGKTPACESHFHLELVSLAVFKKSVVPHRLPDQAPDPVSFRGEPDDFLGNDDQETWTRALFRGHGGFRHF